MNNEEIRKRIVEILDNTFKVIDQCYRDNYESKKANFNNTGSRIIFPSYRNGGRRISEQELKNVFIEQFSLHCIKNEWNAYYSVETPTKNTYRFSKKDEKIFPHVVEDINEPENSNKPKENGESARMDMCIHSNTGLRICLIEFKAGKPQLSNASSYIKDFLKMSEESAKEGSIPCFFVHLFAPEKDYRKQLKQVISSYLKNNNANDEDIKKFHRDNLFYVSHSIGQNSFTQARLYELFESSATF